TYKAIGGEVHRLRELSSVDIYESLRSEPVRALMVKNGPMTRIHELVREILDEVLSHDLLTGLTSIKSADADIYQHSIDVCAISIVVGRTVGLDKKRLRQLATGALLHDVGSIFLESHGRDAAYIVQHTKLGYELLRNNDDPDILAPHVAYEHHEHQDGPGLPRGLRGDNMIERHHGTSQTVPTLIGEIAAIANAYDNLLSGRDGGEPMTPDLALQHIRENAGSTFNRAIVAAFLRVTPVFPKGTEVIIRAGTHKGYTAIVAEVHPGALDRPIITLTHDAHNHPIEPRLIDLLDTPNTDIRAKGI
ncbi:MAG: hypothetical protein QG656_1722, partial [Candidatus Hydrogenedentes bacterium]|nr:hypothetical protein [Candidatus Hydrogenedentota bacterium]